MIFTQLIIPLSIALFHVHCQNEQLNCQRDGKLPCYLIPETTQGPYSWNTSDFRKDITEGKSGIPLRLSVTVIDTNNCSAIANAFVEIWQCDAIGIYSRFEQASNNIANAQPDNTTYLRGFQLSDSNGSVTFQTIYPGWYRGRATHIHVRVRFGGIIAQETQYYVNGTISHTGQFFFNEIFTDQIAQLGPYNTHRINRTLNDRDGIYRESNGSYQIVDVQYENPKTGFVGGLCGSVVVGVNSSRISSGDDGRPPPPPGNRTSTAPSTTSSITPSTTTSSAASTACFTFYNLFALLFIIILNWIPSRKEYNVLYEEK